MSKDKLKALETDLKELLKKHDAVLSVFMEGDTHGITEDYIDVSFKLPKKEGDRFHQWTDAVEINLDD